MTKLENNVAIINSIDCDPATQIIMMPKEPTKWDSYTRSNQLVRNVYYSMPLCQDGNVRFITRADLGNGLPQERVVKALLWAFIERPNGVPSENIIEQLPLITESFVYYSEMTLNISQFIYKYREILARYDDMGKSIMSVLMYGFKVKSGSLKSIAITSYVDEAMQYFTELRPLRGADYFEQLWCIHSEALKLKVDIERLEYFLYRVGKKEIKIV